MRNLRIALFQPDIPGNTGAVLRLAACFGLSVDVILPAGFDISDRNLKRSAMDYIHLVPITRHDNWEAFEDWRASEGRRLVLASTKAAQTYTSFEFQDNDIIMFGRESAGVPDYVHEKSDARLIIPMVQGPRSFNLSVSVAIITSEAMRQLNLI